MFYMHSSIFKGFEAQWILHLRTLLLILTLSISNIGSITAAESSEPNFQDQYEWIVQVLTYREGKLLNQGSGFIVGVPAVVVTAAHLLEKSDEWFVVLSDGRKIQADIRYQDNKVDMAILDAYGSLPLPSNLASRPLRRGDSARIYGYWIDGLEAKREHGVLGLFSDPSPDFIAEKVSTQRYAISVIQDADDAGVTHIAQTGRGAYGSAVINRCGEVAAFNGAPSNKSLKELWLREKTDARRSALTASTISNILKNNKIEPAEAKEICLEASELALQKKNSAEKEATEAKEKALKAQKEAGQERKKAKEAEKRANDAQKEKNRVKEESTTAVEQITDELEKVTNEHDSMLDEYRDLLITGAIIAGLIILFMLLKLRRRRQALEESKEELAQINAPRTNYIFSGSDSQGNPIAIKVLGTDLFKAPGGLLLGRNPNAVQLVIADETISRVHAKLTLKFDHLCIEDYGSSSGTSIDQIKLKPSQATELRDGSQLQLGDVVLSLRYEEQL